LKFNYFRDEGYGGHEMSVKAKKDIEKLGQDLNLTAECNTLVGIGIPAQDILRTLERIHRWRVSAFKRKWNFYREVVNTIRGNSLFLSAFLSVDPEPRKRMLETLRLFYVMPELNYRDRLILLTKFILAQINPLGNVSIRQKAVAMVREFVLHEDMEIRNATFRGITFEVARLRMKGGEWYVQPLVDMLVQTLRDDPKTREYIRKESMEVYYTQEQRDVVDDMLVAVTLDRYSRAGGQEA
jgi:hypothetical protein